MVLFCCVINCGSRAQRDPVRFFRIPAELQHKHRTDLNELSRIRRQSWLRAIKRADLDELKLKYAYVCSRHFITGKSAALTDNSNPDWIPSLNMGYKPGSATSTAVKLERYKRKRQRAEKNEASTSQHHEESTEGYIGESCPIPQEVTTVKIVQTNMTCDDITKLNLELMSALKIRDNLEKRVVSCQILKYDQFHLKYYTGLPTHKHFEIVINLTKSYVSVNANTVLPVEEQILLTLIKLRLNLDFKDLAFRFGISPTTASTYFKNIINIMYMRIKNFVFWPSREQIKKTMPQCFKEAFHEKTTVIIDCFEIRIQKPSLVLAAAQSYSNYKHGQTIKYLIGITPQGSVCFISEGWGGRVSDKCVTENSEFLKNLIPGDVVMADRGFLIKEFVELFRATVEIPGFTRGHKQLHPVELERTRAMAQCRIHVERVIGLLRQKFNILNDKTSIVLLSTGGEDAIFDKIVHVCCALINLCPPIVPL
nr:unnamed protein product [Callosobruchus chinensis]